MSDYVRITMTLPNGTRKYYTGKTRKEAEAKRDADKVRIGTGISVGDKTTFRELEQMWFDLYKKDRIHKRSEETIRFVMNQYVLPRIGDLKIVDVKPIHIQALLRSVDGYSQSVQKKVIQMTRAVFNVGVENGLIPRNPVTTNIKPTAERPEEVPALSTEQCREFLENSKGKRGYPLVVLLLTCGLRRGEVLGLMWKDIDFNERILHIRRSIVYPNSNKRGEISDGKTKSAMRDVPLRDDVLALLMAEKKKSHSVWVFSISKGENAGSYLSESAFRRMWDECKAGLSFDVHPHQLRHTFVTMMFENGLDVKQVQYLAGHASPDVTLAVYTHYREQERKEKTADMVRGTDIGVAI